MKAPTCLVCGSADIIMDEGVFICHNCGCKYSLKQMREIVSGNIPVEEPYDQSKEFAAEEERMRRLYRTERLKEAYKIADALSKKSSDKVGALIILELCQVKKQPVIQWQNSINTNMPRGWRKHLKDTREHLKLDLLI